MAPKQTPSFLQVETSECGIVSLAMILGYYDHYVSIESLRVESGLSRDGCDANMIIETARIHGLDAEGYQVDSLDPQSTQFPCLIHWNFNHFLVCEGIEKDRVYINDPANGHRDISLDEFNQSFTGIVIECNPSTSFKKCGERKGSISALKKYLKPVKPLISIIFILGLLSIFPGILMPVLSRVFIDDVLLHHIEHWLYAVMIGLVLVGFLQAVLGFYQAKVMLVLQTRLGVSLNNEFMQKVLSLPLAFFSQRSASEMASRPMMIDRITQLISGPLGLAFVSAFTAFIYFLVMLFYDFVLSFVILAIALSNFSFFLWQTRQFQKLNQIAVKENGQYSGSALQNLQLLPEIKASGAEKYVFSKILGQKIKGLNVEHRIHEKQAIINVLPSWIQYSSTAILLLIGGWRVISGDMTIGVFVAFQGLMQQFLAPFQQVLSLVNELQESQGNIDRLEDVSNHQEKDKVNWSVPELSPKKLMPKLELKNISFGYDKKRPLLEDFNLEIKEGQWVALVGASGSGKSSLIKLINRLYQPWSGTIKVGGMDLDSIESECLAETMGYVDQNIILFNDTITNNLSLWDSRQEIDSLMNGAKEAEIHDWIIHRPGGYQYKLAENAKNVSGGEKARLELARVLAKKPNLLLLDEATSALDPLLEKEIIENVKEMCPCGIIVTHRLPAIQFCDEIIVFNDGKPVQRGTHEELLKDTNGFYMNLLKEDS